MRKKRNKLKTNECYPNQFTDTEKAASSWQDPRCDMINNLSHFWKMKHVNDDLDLSTGKAQAHDIWYGVRLSPYHPPHGLHLIPPAIPVCQTSFKGLEADFLY